jgi:hypothetical protein
MLCVWVGLFYVCQRADSLCLGRPAPCVRLWLFYVRWSCSLCWGRPALSVWVDLSYVAGFCFYLGVNSTSGVQEASWPFLEPINQHSLTGRETILHPTGRLEAAIQPIFTVRKKPPNFELFLNLFGMQLMQPNWFKIFSKKITFNQLLSLLLENLRIFLEQCIVVVGLLLIEVEHT